MISQTVNGLERRVTFHPAYHKVHTDPKKNYGVHGMEIHFYVIGKEGAVHFLFMTGMMLDETYEWWKERMIKVEKRKYDHMGIDVGYHSPTPQFEGQELRWPTKMVKKDGFDIIKASREAATGDKLTDATKKLKEITENISWEKIGDEPPVCDIIGVPCYCDGSALLAEEWMDIFLHKGDEAIWGMLEEEYKGRFL